MTTFKCMLAGKAVPEKLRFPLIVQPKLDGIRASVVDGRLLSRTLKPIPNRFIFDLLSKPEFNGLDGELIVGPPTAEDCYRQTASGVMRESGEPDFTYWVFDKWDHEGGYIDRLAALLELVNRIHVAVDDPEDALTGRVRLVTPVYVHDADELAAKEQELVVLGYEGAILRAPDAPYKFGRGSATKGDLLKLKRFEDSEAVIIGVEEEMHNANEAKTNALGRTERSSAKAGLVGKGTLGKLLVRDIHTGVEFSVGSGFDAAERADLWKQHHSGLRGNALYGQVIRYKFFPVGIKSRPRHPVFQGFRHDEDMPELKSHEEAGTLPA